MRAIAKTYRRAGDERTASDLERKSDALRGRFNRDYWIDEIGTYALARERHGKPLKVVSSNPGHALWAGIADEDKAKRTANRLLEPDMYSGWGVRTLSMREVRYNPVGYHLGTVWPHDNAIFAHGLRKYGLTEQARRVFRGILEAATYFPDFRLPEVFAGFARNEYGVPVRYPVACHPQAWAAGSIPYLLVSCLGLEPNAPDRKLRVNRPFLPDYTTTVTVEGLRVADAGVDLRFTGAADDVEVEVINVDGDLRVELTDD
jgi:glycogen debranching enzyme